MADGLMPCPWCGGVPWIDEREGGWMLHHNCTFVESCWFETEEEAIEDWNTRQERTCEVDGSISWDSKCYPTYYEHELSCGHTATTLEGEPPRYCGECGARVVKHG